MVKHIRIPDKTRFHVWSDTEAYFESPGDGSVEYGAVLTGSGPATGDGLLLAAGGDYLLTVAGSFLLLA